MTLNYPDNCRDFPIIEDPSDVIFLPGDEDGELWLKHQEVLKALQYQKISRFTREVKITAALQSFKSLKELVEVADSMFNTVAHACSAQVVDHTWKLAKKQGNPSERDHELSTHIPLGYALTADTKVLRGTEDPTKDQTRLIQVALSAQWNTDPSTEISHFWPDGNTEQFKQAEGLLWLVDIEPLIIPYELADR